MRCIPVDERRARLVARHHLARTAGSIEQAAGDLVGLHSSDPATPFLSLRARIEGLAISDVEEVLYQDRALLRLYGMRRTLFVVPRDVAEDVASACTRKIAREQRRRIIGYMERGGWGSEAEAWLDEVSGEVAMILDAAPEPLTGRELSEVLPEMRRTVSIGPGEVGMTTRILFLMAVEGRIVRARPRGSWISSQYGWAPFERWAGGPLAGKERHAAIAGLIARYLTAYGPASHADLTWWSGLGKRDISRALTAIDAERVMLAGSDGYVLRGDTGSAPHTQPVVALLPSLDPTSMGWKERDWYFGAHISDLFDRNGNAGPTIWLDGRVVGGWIQTPGGSVAFRLLEPVGSEAEGMIESEVRLIEHWLEGTVVTPRFRTPLERELSGS